MTNIEEDPWFFIAFLFLLTTVVCSLLVVVQFVCCFFSLVIVILGYQLILERKARKSIEMKINETNNELSLPDEETMPLLRRNGSPVVNYTNPSNGEWKHETNFLPIILRKLRLGKYREIFADSPIRTLRDLLPDDVMSPLRLSSFKPRTPILESIIQDEDDISFFCSFLESCVEKVVEDNMTNLNEKNLFRLFLSVSGGYRTGKFFMTKSHVRNSPPSETKKESESIDTFVEIIDSSRKEEEEPEQDSRLNITVAEEPEVEEHYDSAIFLKEDKSSTVMLRFREIETILHYLELTRYADNFKSVKIEELLDLESDPEMLDELIPPNDDKGKEDQRTFLLFLENSSNELEEREMNDDEFEMNHATISTLMIEVAKRSSLGKDEKDENSENGSEIQITEDFDPVDTRPSINEGTYGKSLEDLGYGEVFSPNDTTPMDDGKKWDIKSSSPDFEEDSEENEDSEEEEEKNKLEDVGRSILSDASEVSSTGVTFQSLDVMDILFSGKSDKKEDGEDEEEKSDFVPIPRNRGRKTSRKMTAPSSKGVLSILDSLVIEDSQNISEALTTNDEDADGSSSSSSEEEFENEGKEKVKTLEEVNKCIDTFYCPIPQKKRFDPKVIAKRGPMINQGSYGQIQLVYLDLGGEDLVEACEKIIILSSSGNTKKSIKREVSILKMLKHRHLLNCFGSYSKNETAEHIVLEYCSGGDLFSKKKVFKLGQKLKAILEMTEGMAFLHSKNIVHRDLKPQNIFITSKGSCKIGDFGTSTAKEKAGASLVGTVEYLAPEIMDVTHISRTVKKVMNSGDEELISSFGKDEKGVESELKKYCDIYSYGIILWELLSERQPFVRLRKKSRNNQFEMMNRINSKNIRPNVNRIDDFGIEEIKFLKDLMCRCWDKDILKRPRGFNEILKLMKKNGVTEEFINTKFGN